MAGSGEIRRYQLISGGPDRRAEPGDPGARSAELRWLRKVATVQAVEVGAQIFVSGTTGVDTAIGKLAGDNIQLQVCQVLANCEAILQAAGAGLDDVVEVGVLLTDRSDFADMNQEYARWFPTDPPTRYVAKLGVEISGLLVSIRMTAIVS